MSYLQYDNDNDNDLKFIFGVILVILFLIAMNLHGQTRFVVPCNKALLEKSRVILVSQIGVTEKTGHNDGEVEKYLKAVGLSKGNPYCAAFQFWCFDSARKALRFSTESIPVKQTGLANGLFNQAKQDGTQSIYRAFLDDLIIWKQQKSSKGHVGRIIEIRANGWVVTVEGNTGGANQREGDGVHKKLRNIKHPLSKMLVRGLVGFK